MNGSAWVPRWLVSCVALCAAMVVVGGVTRLTGSGLSITEWRPVTGAIPPISHDDWEALFALYRESPQFRLMNAHFELQDFQRIFWWEWFHRLLGRVVGLVYLLPLIVLWRLRALPPWLAKRGAALVLLVGFQGLLGWLMVASGLRDQPAVSHLRLAAHLSTALVTFGVTLYTLLEVQAGRRAPRSRALWAFLALLTVQIVWGAFVAGLRAGLLFNTWPTMNGFWLPEAVLPTGALRELVSEPSTVQFVHRWFAVVVLAAGGFVGWRLTRSPETKVAGLALAAAVSLQFALGVVTILWFLQAPVLLGALHQSGAVALLAAAIFALHRSGAARA